MKCTCVANVRYIFFSVILCRNEILNSAVDCLLKTQLLLFVCVVGYLRTENSERRIDEE